MRGRHITAILCLLGCLSVGAQMLTTGVATYYSDKLHGRRMSNGEKYNKDSFTCAHLKYPLGTLLKVKNPKNSREVIVRVTDRGPFSRRFTIDLSRAAARELDILRAGVAMVEIIPYYPNEVPYKPNGPENEEDAAPELDMENEPAATYPTPVWQQNDSIPQSQGSGTPHP